MNPVDAPARHLSAAAWALAVIAALYLGREVFIPVALAVLLSFILAPVVSFLERLGTPKVIAVVSAVSVAFILIAGFGYTVAAQLTLLADNLPTYQANILSKVEALRTAALSEGIVGRVGRFIEALGRGISSTGPTQDVPAVDKPAVVRVEEPASGPLDVIRAVIGPVIGPLATAGVVIILVVFILLQRQDLRDRFIRLTGTGGIGKTTEAMEDAGARVARYLLMQLIVNVTYGIPITLGLWWIGVPNALLWGLLATIFRFVPYVGPVIAAILPIALSVAVDSGWSMLLWTAALFLVVELLSNNVAEPWLYGSGTGLSAFAIIVAAIFWTWLWGPVGLLLSTPITVCLVVLGRHVPAFSFLEVLFGSEPVLSPAERMTQRLLAGDADEATEIAEAYLAENSFMSLAEKVCIASLVSIERERDLGAIDPARRRTAAETMITVMENLSDYQEEAVQNAPAPATPTRVPQTAVLCTGGRGSVDDAASAIVAALLTRAGVAATATPLSKMNSDGFALDAENLVLISYVSEHPHVRARYLAKRLLRRDKNTKIVLGFWATESGSDSDPAPVPVLTLPFLVSIPHLVDHIQSLEVDGPSDPTHATTVVAKSESDVDEGSLAHPQER